MAIKGIKDGGYYAIKGFEFQIDKSILDILNSSDENKFFEIEKIQDVGSNDFVTQIKYKETQKFIPSIIKNPTIQLLEEFKRDGMKEYVLYTYFADLNGYETFVDSKKRITPDKLDLILGDEAILFTVDEKKKFAEKFCLDFAPTFQEQFEKVISLLKRQRFIGDSDDEAVFYYANIADYLRKLVANNINPSARKCTKKQILDFIRSGKRLVFNSAFKDYKGETSYCKFIKSKFIKAKRNQESFIFIGKVAIDNSMSMSKLIIDILDKYYKNAMYNIKPLTLIIHDDIIMAIKKDLISEGVVFNDGYEQIQFNQGVFWGEPIVNKKMAKNGRSCDSLAKISFKLRLLSMGNFNNIPNYKISPKMVYYFDSATSDKLESVSFIKIDGLNTRQISEIFTF